MELYSSLTNEEIKKRFDSQFDLVNYLIDEAQKMIASGRAPRVEVHTDNVAVAVVAEVIAGKDQVGERQEESNLNNIEVGQEEVEPQKV